MPLRKSGGIALHGASGSTGANGSVPLTGGDPARKARRLQEARSYDKITYKYLSEGTGTIMYPGKDVFVFVDKNSTRTFEVLKTEIENHKYPIPNLLRTRASKQTEKQVHKVQQLSQTAQNAAAAVAVELRAAATKIETRIVAPLQQQHPILQSLAAGAAPPQPLPAPAAPPAAADGAKSDYDDEGEEDSAEVDGSRPTGLCIHCGQVFKPHQCPHGSSLVAAAPDDAAAPAGGSKKKMTAFKRQPSPQDEGRRKKMMAINKRKFRAEKRLNTRVGYCQKIKSRLSSRRLIGGRPLSSLVDYYFVCPQATPLDKLPRKELLAVAKKHGIKPLNVKSEQLIDALDKMRQVAPVRPWWESSLQ